MILMIAAGLLTVMAALAVVWRAGSETSLSASLPASPDAADDGADESSANSDPTGPEQAADPDAADDDYRLDPGPEQPALAGDPADEDPESGAPGGSADSADGDLTDAGRQNGSGKSDGSGGKAQTPATNNAPKKKQNTPTTKPKPARTSTTANTSSNPTSAPRRSTTTQRSTTVTTTTATTAPPTTAPLPLVPFDGPVIASPDAGQKESWLTPTFFRFNEVPGALSYCITLQSLDSSFRRCTRALEWRLFPKPPAVPAGPVTVTVEAFTETGFSLATDEQTFYLLVDRLASALPPGNSHDMDGVLALRSRSVPNAEEYCWHMSQGPGVDRSGCSRYKTINFGWNTFRINGFVAGEALTRYTALGPDGQLLAEQFVTFNLTDD